MYRPILRIFLLVCLPGLLFAQLDNTAFEQPRKVNPENEHRLLLRLNVLGFVKNNEYSDALLEGYTLFGYQFNPELTYFPHKNIRVDAGIYMQKDFGNSRFTEIAPTFSFTYQKDSLSLIFGTLEGSISHRLPEPLFDFERVLNRRLENGLQVKIEKRSLFLDGWINWENAIYPGDNEREELTAGLSLVYTFYRRNNLSISLPIHVIANHLGGEIDISPEPVTTILNSAVGISIEKTMAKESFLKSVRMDNYFSRFSDNTTIPSMAYRDGNGGFLNLTFNTRWLSVMGSYWNGQEYLSSKGGLIYQTQSSRSNEPVIAVKKRELLILRLMRDFQLTDECVISARLEPFVDLQNGELKFSQGIYINYRTNWFLLKPKRSKEWVRK